MSLPISKHIDFFDHQLLEMENERRAYMRTPVRNLWKDGKLFIGRIWGFDKVRGQLIIRFKNGRLPRLKVPYQMCLISSTAGTIPDEWFFSYDNFRQKHSKINSKITPVYFMKPEGQWRYQGCNQISSEFLSAINNDLENSKHPMVIIAEEDPPFRYLENLKKFVFSNPNNKILNLDVDLNPANWNPFILPKHDILADYVLKLIEKQPITIIQGPPGTGKTYLVSQICESFLKASKSVCVTTLTNKTLTEIAKEKPLTFLLNSGRISKRNLSLDEMRNIPNLHQAKDTTAIPGEMILSTYFLLSDEINELEGKSKKFDLIIIEEASQAYLATIAAFIELGVKVLVVGDPMQLYPIVLEEEICSLIHPKINLAIKGLQTFAYSNVDISCIIKDTYRLTKKAASQTGVFYNNQLESVSPLNEKKLITTKYSELICSEGGTSVIKYALISKTNEYINMAVKIAIDIQEKNENFEIAILSNLKRTVELIYDEIFNLEGNLDQFTIETIDRIQGLTCDVCIVILEDKIHFGLQQNRFNVATSRAKRGTIILTRSIINDLKGISPNVQQFINQSKTITN
ncbi:MULTISPECIES: AAA domain-containing protein [Flavobacteriaceae]|uniref:DNA2/NAM7 helicase-like C-terminal domain-containing protein n=2 Tax=Flavobacteriaceae TaxID=49546 RepID=A0A4Y8ATC9_9FLAO|nr:MULTISPECIES: AAA domain-containing protein [Flavobacteriaceae]TEW75129.1 hypothetical protein E2488_06295 [Gramella jeungdoensis]GGK41332.1 hypothetical protein GCM10007963_06710 [Lutibacter litoralis]